MRGELMFKRQSEVDSGLDSGPASKVAQICNLCNEFAACFARCGAINSTVNTFAVVVVAKRRELAFEIDGIPKQRLVEKLAPDRPNEALDKGMGRRRVRNRLALIELKNPKILFPAVKFK